MSPLITLIFCIVYVEDKGGDIVFKKLLMMTGVMIILSGLIVLYNIFDTNTVDVAATVVMIDINPSVKITLDEDEKVISVKAMNDDAKTLNYDDIIGLDVEVAIEIIVLDAKAAGYINENDLEEDYVLITTIPLNNGQDKTEKVKEKIRNRIENSDELQSVNVAIIKANKVEMLEAEGKKVPVGLYVVNGKITVDGEEMTVKAYFSNSYNVNKFKEKGTVVEKRAEKKREQLMRYLLRVEKEGVDISSYLLAMDAPDADLDEITSQLKQSEKERKNQNKGNKQGEEKGGNSNKSKGK